MAALGGWSGRECYHGAGGGDGTVAGAATATVAATVTGKKMAWQVLPRRKPPCGGWRRKSARRWTAGDVARNRRAPDVIAGQ